MLATAKMLWRVGWVIFCFVGPCLASHAGLAIDPVLRNALERVHQGHYEQAIVSARELQASFPEHPFPSMIAAEANFGLIYCETGHIT
ncbi:MAG: hypothetical protein HYS38_01845, partial [Acidobacteria bacterium]|nr:hypothetical protein [Acidobacteriota bacterium]